MVTEFSQNFPRSDKFSSTPSHQCPTATEDDGDSAYVYGIAAFIHCKALKSEIMNIICSLTFAHDIKRSSRTCFNFSYIDTRTNTAVNKILKNTCFLYRAL
jgi:hypothetical protein